MLVILAMTGDTLAVQLLLLIEWPFLWQVTCIAFGLLVLALQLVLGIAIMFERAGLPVLFVMADLALVAITPLMPLVLIILAVTGHTLLFQFEFCIRA